MSNQPGTGWGPYLKFMVPLCAIGMLIGPTQSFMASQARNSQPVVTNDPCSPNVDLTTELTDARINLLQEKAELCQQLAEVNTSLEE